LPFHVLLENLFTAKTQKTQRKPGQQEKRFTSFDTWIANTCDKKRVPHIAGIPRLFFLLFFAFFAPLR